MRDVGAGFGHDSNKITIFGNAGTEFNFEMKSKTLVARDIINTILNNKHV